MQYVHLGRSGVRVSRLCLGAMNFGASVDENTSIDMIHQGLDHGINFLDTADVYARGTSEEIVAKALTGGRREKVVLATKGSGPRGDDPNDVGASRFHMIRACEDSLRRLRTDRIDLYQVHIPDLTTPVEQVVGTMEVLINQGKVLYWGTSKWPASRIVEAMFVAEKMGIEGILTEQPPYNILDRRIENELVWVCELYGIGIIPWGPLASGLLSGLYRKGQPSPEGHRFSNVDIEGGDNERFDARTMDAVERLVGFAEEKGCSLPEFAHAWLLAQPRVTSPIIGPSKPEHIDSAVKSLEVKLTGEDLRKVDEIVAPGQAVANYYDKTTYEPVREIVRAGNGG